MCVCVSIFTPAASVCQVPPSESHAAVRGGGAPASAERCSKAPSRSRPGRRRPAARRVDRAGGGGSGRAKPSWCTGGCDAAAMAPPPRPRQPPTSGAYGTRARARTGGEPCRGRERDVATDPAPHTRRPGVVAGERSARGTSSEQSAEADGTRSASLAPAVAPPRKRMRRREHAGETRAAAVAAAGRPRRTKAKCR